MYRLLKIVQTKSFTVKYYTIVSLSPDNAKIYVANTLSNDIYIIDGTNNSAVASIPVGTHPCSDMKILDDRHDLFFYIDVVNRIKI
jgi:YVTN family beta-propeller protein